MKKLLNTVINIAVYAIPLTLWELFGNKIIPSPTVILTTLFKILPGIVTDIGYTLLEAFGGLLIGTASAVLLVMLMDLFIGIRKSISPIIITSQAIPFNIISPVLVMVLGFGIMPKIMVVSLVCFFPLVLTLLTALDNIPHDLLEAGSICGANKLQKLIYLKMPLSIPHFFSGLKISAVYSISSAVIAEWMAGDTGLGMYMLRAKRSFNNDRVFAVVLLITVFSMAVYYLLEKIQKNQEERQ